jgi:hypothetical protein
MKKSIFIFLFFIFVFLISFLSMSIRSIIIESESQKSFEINKDFSSFRKSLKEEDLMNKTIEASGGSILEKNWISAKVDIKRPILKNWKFSGDVVFKFSSKYKDKNIIVSMKQNLLIDNDYISCKNKLTHPVEEIDLYSYNQDLDLKRSKDKTAVNLKLTMQIKKLIPVFMKSYVKKELDKELEKQINNLQKELEKLSIKEESDSISIKLK